MLALTSLKPEPLMAGEQKVNLFRHGIRLQLEGGYFDVYQYLKALEALPRHFYWKGFDYRVVEHPKAAVWGSLLALQAQAEVLQDPTMPLAGSGSAASVAKEAGLPRLQSVILGSGPALAVLDGQSYRVGQQVNGFRLVGISADSVVLEKAGKRQTLTLFGSKIRM